MPVLDSGSGVSVGLDWARATFKLSLYALSIEGMAGTAIAFKCIGRLHVLNEVLTVGKRAVSSAAIAGALAPQLEGLNA